jgi:hypothetical protein
MMETAETPEGKIPAVEITEGSGKKRIAPVYIDAPVKKQCIEEDSDCTPKKTTPAPSSVLVTLESTVDKIYKRAAMYRPMPAPLKVEIDVALETLKNSVEVPLLWKRVVSRFVESKCSAHHII